MKEFLGGNIPTRSRQGNPKGLAQILPHKSMTDKKHDSKKRKAAPGDKIAYQEMDSGLRQRIRCRLFLGTQTDEWPHVPPDVFAEGMIRVRAFTGNCLPSVIEDLIFEYFMTTGWIQYLGEGSTRQACWQNKACIPCDIFKTYNKNSFWYRDKEHGVVVYGRTYIMSQTLDEKGREFRYFGGNSQAFSVPTDDAHTVSFYLLDDPEGYHLH